MRIYKKIERKNRQNLIILFILPIIFLIAIFYNLNDFINVSLNIFFAFLFLIIFIFYYFIYIIYKYVKKNEVDMKIGCLYQNKFIKFLNNEDYIVYFNILNANDLKIKFGFDKSDNLISKIINKFYEYDEKLIIGKITSSEFMILSKEKYKNLQHEMKKIFLEIKRERIDGIDFKIKYSIVKSNNNFLKLYIDAQNSLKNDLNSDSEILITTSINNAIKKKQYILKLQELEGKEKIQYLNYKINFDYPEKINQTKIEELIIKGNLEFKYYKNLLNLLLEEVDFKNRIIIKISAEFLRNLNFLFYLGEYFIKNPHTKGKYIFEFCENEIYYDLTNFEEIIKEYQEIGISFALNKIGSPISLEYLKRFDFEFGVFDIEFNKNIQNYKYFVIYKSLFNLCKELNIKTIMRFIDDKNLLDAASDIKFDYYQGFLFHKDKNIKEKK